ncbi:MAG TPA: histidinol dehydrogenase [Terriglobales bacterium]|nr:histidinol dehydrogenase [Terriglobales bacterium]
MRILLNDRAEKWVASLAQRAGKPTHKEAQVRRIIADVRRHGDAALRRYGRQWDQLGNRTLCLSTAEMRRAFESAPAALIANLETAATNIRQFAQWQMPAEWVRKHNGITTGQLVRPLASVGCYVPGGRYPLLSTMLMTVIPAQIAGVPRICVASPNPKPALLATAHLLGVPEFYCLGGAQAIAALAYGTKSIPRVDKIVGPGNVYVTIAKKLVAFDCAIDMLAGPTESVIVTHHGNPKWIAADLVAQAEHDPDTLPIAITGSQRLAEEILAELRSAAQSNPVAQQALRKSGCILIAGSRAQAMRWANALAPEHITVEKQDVNAIVSAGSVFVGDYSPQAAGDYTSGPNHVLPTAGAARFRGGLSVLDFVKLVTVQELTKPGLRKIAPVITSLAEGEGLVAHAESIRVRFQHA